MTWATRTWARSEARSKRRTWTRSRNKAFALPSSIRTQGAFTGAVNDRVGRFQLADRATLFLDEVAEIPLELQSKLLRVLQEGTFERIGEAGTRKVNVRVIAATNHDLAGRVSEGHFREDLYYRLNVFPITIAPLRERVEDIPDLAVNCIENSCRRLGVPVPKLKRSQLRMLQRHDWPGNVRELQNVIERAPSVPTSLRHFAP